MYTIFKSETKKNTTLLLVELLAVTWAPYILEHTILIGCIYFETVLNGFVSK